jgi:hypothetical protein
MGAPTPAITVVYLMWAPLDIDVIEGFVRAYRTHPAGAEHRLAVIFNGFEGAGDPRLEAAEQALEGLDYERILTGGPLLDLAAYSHAAATLDARLVCLLNSYSRPLRGGWLAAMASVASHPAVGLVGATGSWGSRYSHTRYAAGLGGPYAGVFDDRASTERVFAGLSGQQPQQSTRARDQLGSFLRSKFDLAASVALQAARFPPFPAPHVRTNGLLVDRLLWLRLCSQALGDKQATYRLESGRNGITTRVNKLGMKVLVVGSDGVAYESQRWPDSRTFWQADQENLLIGDNQTQTYERASADMRLVLARYAWGRHAAPSEAQIAGAS